jgi:hypothetical protein
MKFVSSNPKPLLVLSYMSFACLFVYKIWLLTTVNSSQQNSVDWIHCNILLHGVDRPRFFYCYMYIELVPEGLKMLNMSSTVSNRSIPAILVV